MLSRSAQGVYWMSRYLGRAEHLCRLLRLQTEALVDRPLREIHLGWIRIYNTVSQRRPEGDLRPSTQMILHWRTPTRLRIT